MRRHAADALLIREIALEVAADYRSVQKELTGGTVTGLVGCRIRRALRARGLPCSQPMPDPRPLARAGIGRGGMIR